MKSVKPGRGPSLMGGIMSVLVGLFGVAWMVFAVKMGFGFFALLGLIFVAVAAVQAVFSFKNATGENRYSAFDITEGYEESDPLNDRYSVARDRTAGVGKSVQGSSFCPYCGTPVKGDYEFCNSCGKQLP